MTIWISSDLDGSLLDHHTYSYAAAKPALELCAKQQVPIVLNTSKTEAETRALHSELGLRWPIAIENGSALVFFDGKTRNKIFGQPRDKILNFIETARSRNNFSLSGFNDLGLDGIIEHTGLSKESAELAAERHYSEPFIWHDSNAALMRFVELAFEQDLIVLKGGRFYHLQGKTDKAQPLIWLQDNLNIFYAYKPQKSELVCLGDNHNDIAMLDLADYPVCVKSPSSPFPKLTTDKAIIFTQDYGPVGWNKAVLELLETTQ